MSKIKLFCFPHAGGSALYYSKWNKYFMDDIEFEIVKYPGRETRINDPMPDSIQKLAEDFVNAITVSHDEKYAFFGHSMGASVAYEAALIMKEKYNILPICMFVSGADAPGTLAKRFGEKLDGVSVSDIDNSTLCQLVKAMGGVDEVLLESQDFMDYYLPIIRKDMVLCELYNVTKVARLGTKMKCMYGEQDRFVSDNDVGRWQLFTEYPVTVNSFSGDHFYIDDHIEELTDYMKKQIIEISKEPLTCTH